jgi:hypothetical protein
VSPLGARLGIHQTKSVLNCRVISARSDTLRNKILWVLIRPRNKVLGHIRPAEQNPVRSDTLQNRVLWGIRLLRIKSLWGIRHSRTTVQVESFGEFENILGCESEAHMGSIHERSHRSKSRVTVPLSERFLL